MDDSPPFSVLTESAEDFKAIFDGDIANILATLNSKITALMCDPDSLGSTSGGPKSNAHVEFSMAKYKILASMREVFDEAAKGWVDSIGVMKDEFMENIEVFLANTKLEVKLPVISVSPRAGNRKSISTPNAATQKKSPSTVSSLYPKLFNTAKNIPVLGSLLSNDQEIELSEEEMEVEPLPLKPATRTPKRVTINTIEQYIPSPAKNGNSRRRGNTPAAVVPVQTVEESEEEEEPVPQTPVKRVGRGRKSIATPASARKETATTPLRRQAASKKNSSSSDDSIINEEIPAPVVEIGRRGRKSIRATAIQEVPISTPARRGRTPRKAADVQQIDLTEEEISEDEVIVEEQPTAVQKTPKQVQFSLGLDPNEDLEIYSPELVMTKNVPRRKTMVTQAMDNFTDISLTPEVVRGKSKRKTIGGNLLDQSVAPSPKRLKRCGGRTSLAPSGLNETVESNLLESEGTSELGRYSQWIPLTDIEGSVPTQPGIYELKVAQAKKPAYIGACDSLRQKLTLHKMSHNSGHKHLDKYIERNATNVLVRYEQMATVSAAKEEEKRRVQNFVKLYKTYPAYNS